MKSLPKIHVRKKIDILFGLLILLSVLVVGYVCCNKRIEANSHILSTKADFVAGVTDGVEYESESGTLRLKADGSWGPKNWATPDTVLSIGTAIVSDGDFVYVLVGRDNLFIRYVPGENRWDTLATPLHMPDYGADMTVLGDYIYAIWGGYQKEVSRYSINTDSWEDVFDLPDLIYAGSSIATDREDLFVLRGYNTTEFWKYDVSETAWVPVLAVPAAIYHGADLVYDNGYLYTPRGNNQKNFYRYDIENNSWTSLANSTASFYDVHNMDVVDGYIYGMQDRSTTTFYRYGIGTSVWETLTDAPATTRYAGVVYNQSDDQLYVLRGNGGYEMWKYDRDEDEFLGSTDAPNTLNSGSDLVYYGGYLYVPRGGNQVTFYRYNLTDNSWGTRADAPGGFNDDSKGVAAGNNLYFLRSSGINDFWQYNPNSDVWTTLPDAPSIVRYGGDLAYPGEGNILYATQGAYTRSFWSYDIGTSLWDDQGVADLPDDAEASYGARLIANGDDPNILYYLSGSRTGQILKYDIDADSWTDIGDLPYAPLWGTDVVYWNEKLYVQAGYYETDFWEFDLATGDNQYTWRKMPDLSSYYAYERGPYNGGSLEIDPNGNMYSTWGTGLSYMQIYSPGTNKYVSSGNWISGVTDLEYVTVGSTMTVSVGATEPVGVGITVQTRTSSDSLTWGNWMDAINGVVGSNTNRYIQIKLIMNSSIGGSDTPIVNDVTINFSGDETDPVSPTSIEAYSRQVSGVGISSGETYNYLNPYFVWSGATDVDTGVEGYYVYFGVGETADPEIDGAYQTDANYLVMASLESNTYYLKIKSKDMAGNISSSWDAFTYVYQGLEYQTLSVGETNSFSGVGTSVSVVGDEIKLESVDGFWSDSVVSYTPATMYYGADLAYSESDNKLYALRGRNTKNFYIYDLEQDSWSVGNTTPSNVYYGGALTEGPEGFLYAFKGYNSTDFWRYETATDDWQVITSAPDKVYQGGSLVYDNSQYVYALKGNNDDAFWRYDTGVDGWEILSNVDFGAPDNQVNNLVRYGGDLAYDGDDTIYAIQGNLRSGFAAYSVSLDEWTPLPNVPALAYGGAEIEYDSETRSIYFVPGYQKSAFFKYDIDNQEWSSLGDTPYAVYYGCSMKNVDGNIYMTRGYNSTSFYEYDASENSWSIPSRDLFGKSFRGTATYSFSTGSSIVKGEDGNFYISQGNNSNHFISWNEITGEVVELASTPTSMQLGGAMVYVSGTADKIYAVTSQYNRKFYEYDVSTDIWSEVSSDPPPVDPNNGSSLTYDGARFIYWTRGGANSFYRYDTQGLSESRWQQLTNIPTSLGYGGEALYKQGFVYVMRGAGSNPNPFYRFDVGTTSWESALTSVPGRVEEEGFLADGGDADSLYACRGDNTGVCWKYSVSENSWTEISSLTSAIAYGGAGASNGVDKIYIIAGTGTNSYNDGLYGYVMNTDNSSFTKSGSYISEVHDLDSVYKYANLVLTYESANNTDLTSYTRSSDDGETWDDWVVVSSEEYVGNNYVYKINSTPKRYLQIKFELTSGDGVYSGVIDDYKVNYYQDLDKPTNHNELTAYEVEGSGTTLVSGGWKDSVAPFFDWPDAEETGGASDTLLGSGVEGYYVYFGVGETADPEIFGVGVTVSNYVPANLVSGNTYYLRIKAYDYAGNVASGVGTTFVYKIDRTNPTNPQTVTADPPGYSSQNSFTIGWDGASDAGSGIGDYCYKTGQDGFEEICTTDVGVTGLAAYRTGTNTFYVRARDVAGNMPTEYSTTSYYYNSTAPPPPQNLVATPTENSVNEFAFSWDPPSSYYGSQAGLRYYYSINAIPTANNVNAVGLVNTYLPAGPYATQPGDNYFYLLVKDEAGNIDYNVYETAIFSANTTAPGIPTGVEIGDISVKATESWRLALSWDAPVATGSGVSNYKVYRSLVEGADCISNFDDFSLISTTSVASYVDTSLEQLSYYYCMKACDSTGNCSAVSDTVSGLPDGRWLTAPSMVASPSATVRTKSATVSWSTDRTCSSFVKYGTASGDYGEEVGSSDHLSLHEVDLEGLEPGTTYYYKALWTDEDGNTGNTDEMTLTTNAAPNVATVEIVDVSLFSAYVNFVMANATKATIQYGPTVNYGSIMAISTSTSQSEYSVKLDELDEGSVYHLRIVAEDEESNYFYSDDYTFETLPVPKLSDVAVQQVKGMPTSTVRVAWKSNTDISTVVTFYPEGRPEMTKDQVVITLTKKHEMIITDLMDDTSYVMVVKGKDAVGNWAESVIKKIKTAVDLRAPLVSNLKTEVSVVGVGDVAKAQIVVTWDTDEVSTSQVEYGQGTGGDYASKTQEDNRMSSNHLVTITDLKPSEVYHLRVISKDKMNNRTESYDNVVVTPKATKSALDLVVSNLSKSFGFFSNLSKINK